MTDPIDIVAIHGRTEEGNGVSRPFRCEGEDGRDYFVKLKNTSYEGLVKDWVAGRLASEMGLPVAEVRQVRIPRELIAGNPEYERDLGHGIAFGSVKVEASERLSMEFIRSDEDGGLSRILLFDWWIRNSDRALTEIGGNPNLLWQLDPGRVVMIDHDNAFDPAFDAGAFWKYHALRQHISAWDSQKREEMLAWLDRGTGHLEAVWAEIPEEWIADPYGDPRCRIGRETLTAMLLLAKADASFWTVRPPRP